MKKCPKCEFWGKFKDSIRERCTMSILELETECLLRQILWMMMYNQEQSTKMRTLAEKTEKLMDKQIEDLGEGESWKGNNQ